ncbi:diversity-generating retroelement protein Avd [candidate division KSB1 bacterium]|nr:diversity-generating retroelement protein Avd [candidate division KSB1 bacterium]
MQIFKRVYDYSKWLLNHTNKFPKSHRFSVAVKLENTVLEIIELITQANMRHKKIGLLITADEKLLYLKIMTRLSYDMKFLNLTSYEYSAQELVTIGKMLGAWIKQQRSIA